MQNVTDITYMLLLQLLFNLIQEHHVVEKKEEHIALYAFELISRSGGLNLGNLFHLHGLVAGMFFFLEYAGELRIIVLVEEKGFLHRPKHTHTHHHNFPDF